MTILRALFFIIMKVYVVGGSIGYSRWIDNCELVNHPDKAEIILFTGGEDVDPSVYGCKKHPTTYSNINRDLQEKEVFDHIKPNQLAVGICRGLSCGSR